MNPRRGIFIVPLFVQLAIPLSKSSEPYSRQVYLWLRQAILAGTLKGAERLPSTRDLAEQLRISRTVVVLAYEQLLAEGFVRGKGGSGTYVSENLGAASARLPMGSAKLRLSRFGTAAAAAGPKVNFPRTRPRALRYDFAYRRSAVQEFPFETWRRIMLRRARKASLRDLDYGPPTGSLALRRAIAAHLRRSRAVVCDEEQIIIVNGSGQALDLTTRVLLERGDRAVIEDPQYQGAREVFQAAGAELFPIAVDQDGLDPSKLPSHARIAFVTPSHQFPTGAVLPLARRLELLRWAKRADAVVIEDDYDGEFHYEGHPVESMQGLDHDGRVVYVGTFSRTIFPALRIGYMIVPKRLLSALTAAKWFSDRHTPTLEQETLAEFISMGAYERHLRRARRANAARRRALLAAIQKCFADRVAVSGDGSGAHIVLWPATRVSETELVMRAEEAGVGVYGISPYFFRKPKRVGLMLGYSRMNEREIHQGIERLAGAIFPATGN